MQIIGRWFKEYDAATNFYLRSSGTLTTQQAHENACDDADIFSNIEPYGYSDDVLARWNREELAGQQTD